MLPPAPSSLGVVVDKEGGSDGSAGQGTPAIGQKRNIIDLTNVDLTTRQLRSKRVKVQEASRQGDQAKWL